MANSSLQNLAEYSSDEEEVFSTQTIALPKRPISASAESDDSSNEEDEKQPTHSAADQISHSDDEQPVRTSKRIPYALPISHLPEQVQTFLLAVKVFFTQSVNLQRQRPPVSLSTYAKIQERMLCFLGFVKNTVQQERPLTEDCFLRIPLIEGYVDFLRDERNLSAATCANHLSSLLYPVKFLHREHGPDFKDVLIIRQLRSQATILQREGDLERPSTREDFEALNRWISWEEVVGAVTTQRDRFESTHPAKLKAKECADLVLLSLYVYIPPSRGLEVRTLEIVKDRSTLDPKKSTDRNLLIMSDGGIRLQFNRYKTKRFRGRDELLIQPGDELCKVLTKYINHHRPHLVTENRSGQRFSCGAFSAHLKKVIHGLTGKLAGVQVLRSSFVTWCYGKSDCTDAMKNSLAAALRHTRKQAEKTYDRRTANEKKEMAVALARDYAECHNDPEKSDESGEEAAAGGRDDFKAGDFVALVEPDSTSTSPRILLGQILSFEGKTEVLLLWYKLVKHSLYKLTLNGEQWKENLDCLVPVKVQSVKQPAGCYKLLDSPRSIHKQVM